MPIFLVPQGQTSGSYLSVIALGFGYGKTVEGTMERRGQVSHGRGGVREEGSGLTCNVANRAQHSEDFCATLSQSPASPPGRRRTVAFAVAQAAIWRGLR